VQIPIPPRREGRTTTTPLTTCMPPSKPSSLSRAPGALFRIVLIAQSMSAPQEAPPFPSPPTSARHGLERHQLNCDPP
jgi:hypothetical protein